MLILAFLPFLDIEKKKTNIS